MSPPEPTTRLSLQLIPEDPMPDLPHDEDAVRRLLAEARHDQPLPPEVADRLDTLLGRLVEAREEESGVASLAARRRRRRGLLLVAAAAALVFGVGVPTVGRLGTGGDAGSSSDSAATSQESQSQADAGGSTADDSAGDMQERSGLAAPESDGVVVALTSSGFEDEVGEVAQGGGPLVPGRGADGCGPRDLGPGTTYDATYDGRPAVLVIRPNTGTDIPVELFACNSLVPLRTFAIPTP